MPLIIHTWYMVKFGKANQVVNDKLRYKPRQSGSKAYAFNYSSIMPLEKWIHNYQNYILRIQLKWKKNRNQLKMWRKKSLKDKGHLRKLRMTEKTIPKIAKNKKIQPSQNNQSGQHLWENINNGVEIHL